VRRKLPTGRITPVTGTPVRLLVEYENAADFLADYTESLIDRQGVVQTERVVPPGTQVQLGLCFPGLVEPIVLEGVVRPQPDGESTCTHVELLASSTPRLAAIVDRIRARDRRVIVPVARVLIAEDNTHVCELVKSGLSTATRRDLRDMAFDFDTALDGAAALELLKHSQFDAAIIDVYLPVLDGAALIRQIRTTLGLTRMPIIALSGGGAAARNVALRAGATTFLDKPIRLRSIIEALGQLLTVGP
jgi:CheY-like chemotaxis protein